jgi:hypothetical protein
MDAPQQGDDMANMHNVRERIAALAWWPEPCKQQTRTGAPRGWRRVWCVAALVVLGLTLARPGVVQAKIFWCSAGDVPCLIAAIKAANANGTANTIFLRAGTYTLTAVDNRISLVGANGLPVITSVLTITGQGAETTIIERDFSAPEFRLLQVATAGSLTLKRLTLRHGTIFSGDGGGGIHNAGTLRISHSIIDNNFTEQGGAVSPTRVRSTSPTALWHTMARGMAPVASSMPTIPAARRSLPIPPSLITSEVMGSAA